MWFIYDSMGFIYLFTFEAIHGNQRIHSSEYETECGEKNTDFTFSHFSYVCKISQSDSEIYQKREYGMAGVYTNSDARNYICLDVHAWAGGLS